MKKTIEEIETEFREKRDSKIYFGAIVYQRIMDGLFDYISFVSDDFLHQIEETRLSFDKRKLSEKYDASDRVQEKLHYSKFPCKYLSFIQAHAEIREELLRRFTRRFDETSKQWITFLTIIKL